MENIQVSVRKILIFEFIYYYLKLKILINFDSTLKLFSQCTSNPSRTNSECYIFPRIFSRMEAYSNISSYWLKEGEGKNSKGRGREIGYDKISYSCSILFVLLEVDRSGEPIFIISFGGCRLIHEENPFIRHLYLLSFLPSVE